MILLEVDQPEINNLEYSTVFREIFHSNFSMIICTENKNPEPDLTYDYKNMLFYYDIGSVQEIRLSPHKNTALVIPNPLFLFRCLTFPKKEFHENYWYSKDGDDWKYSGKNAVGFNECFKNILISETETEVNLVISPRIEIFEKFTEVFVLSDNPETTNFMTSLLGKS